LHKEPQALGGADFAPYDVVVYYGENSHQKRDFTDAAEAALRDHVRAGKGFVGVHVASYRAEGRLDDLIGGNSPGCVRVPEGLPRLNAIQWEFAVRVADREHPVTAGVQDFKIIDEHYRSEITPDAHVLLRGDDELGSYPLAWVRTVGRGRVFHTPLGHRPDGFGDPQFWRLLVQGILWAGGGPHL
jgi:type 1 glutamine amidotransferase